MNTLVKTLALFFAVTHLWVSGSLLLHTHEECDSKEGSSCHHTHQTTAHEDCAICYYIHLPASIIPTGILPMEYLPTYFYLSYNVSIDSRIVNIKPLPNANKGPPSYFFMAFSTLV